MGKRTKRDECSPVNSVEFIEKRTPAEAVRRHHRRPELYIESR
jgi:hypothetical protein